MNRETQTVIVTGGAVRVGAAVSLRLAQAGYGAIIGYRNSQKAASELAQRISSSGGLAAALPLDLEETVRFAEFFEHAQQLLGLPVTALVNCAALFERAPLDESSEELLKRHFAVNAAAPYLLSQQLAACVRQHHLPGSIVNITDARSERPAAAYSAYYASKGALKAMTASLAAELAPDIRVNAVAPGLVLPRPGKDEGYFAREAGRLPLRRTGTAEDIADAVAYLMRASFVTGEVLRVDGGAHLL